jgi:phosphoesterase RecJ-like protein
MFGEYNIGLFNLRKLFFIIVEQNLNKLRELLTESQHIVVTMHRDPDADAMGSALGWATFLKKCGHQVTVISPTDISRNLMWMHGADQVIVYEKTNETRTLSDQLIQQADLIFCLDFSSLSRLKDMRNALLKAKGTKVIIDHHLEPENFADLLVWDTAAAATAQIIYRLIIQLNEELLDDAIGECLYAGIMTDTGSFRHSNTTPEVHQIVAQLMERTNLNTSLIHQRIFDNSPVSRLHLLGYVLANMVVLPEYNTSYMILSEAELLKYNSVTGDTDGIVNYGLQVEGVVMTALFIERKGEIKISFRSVGDFSVRELANTHFNGGGHFNASGGRSTLDLNRTIEKFLSVLPDYALELKQIQK